MDDLTTLAQIVAVITVTIAPLVVLVRAIESRYPGSDGVLLVPPSVMPWPRGVQEEDPRPWRFAPLDA